MSDDPTPQAADAERVSFVVEPGCDGWRLDRYLCHKLPRLTRNRAQRLIREHLLPIGSRAGRPLKPATLVRTGLVLTLRHEGAPVTASAEVAVLYADADVVVVDKPAGLPMHPTARYRRGTAAEILQARFGPACEAAHRLDLETSGALVCALGAEPRRRLAAAFAAGAVEKRYLAIVEGHPEAGRFEVDAPIAEGTALIRVAVRIDAEAGKPARTLFEVLARLGPPDAPISLLRATPATGRQHQIRVHARHAGFPLVGDKIYGPDPAYFDRHSRGELEAAAWARLRLPRQALHAAEVAFAHPTTGDRIHVEAPLARDLADFLAAAGGQAS